MTRVIVDREVCGGLAECESLVPSVFEVRDEGIATVLVDTVPDEQLPAVRRAVMRCPTGALRLEVVDTP